MKEQLEEMGQFFNKRVHDYEEHMLNNVSGCKEGYKIMADQIPESSEKLLDLGCGTGLELDEIFKKYPDIKVTGIDLSDGMLHKLQEKHFNKNLSLINASYLDYDFGIECYDTVVSFETLHHLSHDEKVRLYTNLYKALKQNGIYIEADYMAPNQEYEDFYYAENKRIREEMGIKEGFYHYDTPCTVSNQKMLLLQSGFRKVTEIWRKENTVMLIAVK
jgi:cyclopropane fatty-acyl-phospholipid synthase-like methyltransferase